MPRNPHVQQTDVQTIHFGTIPATLVQEEDGVIPEGEGITYYLVLSGRPYKVSLFFRGKTHAKYFADVLQAIVKNLEPEKPQ
jgi:hypothetical protein